MSRIRWVFISTGVLLTLVLAACGTLEIGIVSSTEDTLPPEPMTLPTEAPGSTLPSTEVLATPTPTPYVDQGTVEAPAVEVDLTWDRLPPGLVYAASDGLWLVNQDEQPIQIHDNSQAIPSSDGTQILSYDAVQQDAWLIDRADGAAFNLTQTPDRLECCFRWWPARPDRVLFGSMEAGGAQTPADASYALTAVRVDGTGYQILDTEHPVNVNGAQGSLAPSPDGATIAYGSGTTGWLYNVEAQTAAPFDPQAYGLNLDVPLAIALPAWSPDGTHLAWIVKGNVAEDGSSDWTGVVSFDLTARTAQIIYQYASQGSGWPPAPVWNPDGPWLVFSDSSASETAGLWVARIGGTLETQRLGLGGSPIWSPDGRWLAFQSMTQEGLPVYALVEAGTWKRQLLDIPVDRYGKLVAWVALRDEVGSGLTIAGTVRDVALSARIITLDAPVEGVSTIALTEETQLTSADGDDLALRDIKPGVGIKVFGERGEAEALIARQVVVLDAIPSDRR